MSSLQQHVLEISQGCSSALHVAEPLGLAWAAKGDAVGCGHACMRRPALKRAGLPRQLPRQPLLTASAQSWPSSEGDWSAELREPLLRAGVHHCLPRMLAIFCRQQLAARLKSARRPEICNTPAAAGGGRPARAQHGAPSGVAGGAGASGGGSGRRRASAAAAQLRAVHAGTAGGGWVGGWVV